MDLLPLFQSLEASTIGTVVRKSTWMFPIIECIHLLALALLGGTVLAVDMRMLGFGLRSEPSASLSRKLQPWMTGSLVAAIVSGVLMFLSEAIKCYYSPPFWYKMTLLALATIFAFTARRGVAESEPGQIAPALVWLTSIVSLALWFGVGFSGRWIAFY